MEKWKYRKVKVWKSESIEKWKYGKVWRNVSIEKWKYGEMEVSRNEKIETINGVMYWSM
jgi:hypothetical protein